MQNTAFSVCPSISLPKPGRPSNHTNIITINPMTISPQLRSLNFGSVNGLSGASSLRQLLLVGYSSSSSSKSNSWISTPPLVPNCESRVEVRAASVPESAEEDAKANGLNSTLELGSLFCLWILFNIYFNIYNKQNYLYRVFQK